MKKEVISTTSAPAAVGPYSQAIKVGDTLYTSGQIALDPATGAKAVLAINGKTVPLTEGENSIAFPATK